MGRWRRKSSLVLSFLLSLGKMKKKGRRGIIKRGGVEFGMEGENRESDGWIDLIDEID